MINGLLTDAFPRLRGNVAASFIAVMAGIGLLTLSAKVQVPFWPVPMTMQTLVVLMIGLSMGSRLALATVGGWIALGAAGLPVFASGAGLLYVAGPTGGYLAGFLLAAGVLGLAVDRGFGRSFISALALVVLGEILIFAPGVAWLSVLIGTEKAIAGGLLPFLPGEALKGALAVLATAAIARSR